MVLQSHDLASRIAIQREHIGVQQVLAISGVYMDLWWPSAVAASRLNITASQVIQLGSPQLVVLAANAPNFNNRPKKYTKVALDMLIRKVHLIFMVAREKRSPMVLSGLLGGGAYRGNRPLVICLHMLFHEQLFPLKLHVPVFESYSSYPVEIIFHVIIAKAIELLNKIRQSCVTRNTSVLSLNELVELLYSFNLPTSHYDNDIL